MICFQLDEDISEKMAEEQEYRKIRVRMRAEVRKADNVMFSYDWVMRWV